MGPMTEEQERWEFEQAMRRFKVPVVQRHDGEYLHPDARIGWYVWMIRANLKQPTPVEKPQPPP